MTTVGIRELKNRLSEYVRRVGCGETILVTDRGRVVAQLGAPPQNGAEWAPPGLLELARQGRARLGGPNTADLYPQRPVRNPAGTAQELIDWDRDDHC